MTSAPAPLPLPPARGSAIWLAEKLTRKKDVLTYSLATAAGFRLLWITRGPGSRRHGPRAVAPQLVVWAVFWPTALVLLRTGVKWGQIVVEREGLDRHDGGLGRPGEATGGKRERTEVDGEEVR